jgi:YaiO family outer membrane protein
MFHRHRIEATGLFEDFNSQNIENTLGADLRANIRLNDRWRAFGRAQVQRKFGSREERGGLGFEWRWTPATTIAGHLLFGPGDRILPRHDRFLEIDHVWGPIALAGWYRYIQFPIARVSVLSPGIAWWVNERLNVGLRYHLAFTEIGGAPSFEDTHSVLVNTGYRLYPRVWLTGGYARGVESFDTFSPDRLGAFHADTISGGLRIDLPSLTSVIGVYERQWREGDLAMNRVTISFGQRF